MSPISNSGAKSVRFLAAVGLVLLLSSPVVLLWASRVQLTSSGDDAAMAEMSRMEARQIASLQLPEATARPAEYAAFGGEFDYPRIERGRHGLLVTHLGSLDRRNPGALLDRVPAGLRYGADEVTAFDRGALRPGLNYVRIAPSALGAGRGAETEAAVARAARIVGYLSDGWLLVYADGRGMGALRQIEDLSDFVVMEPAFKTGAHVGRRPRINRSEATDPVLRLEVFAVSFADAEKVRQGLERVKGVESVADLGPNAFEVRAHHRAVGAIGRLDEVVWVDETADYMTLNAKNAPTVQMGSMEEGLQIRPYDDAGVDGGGIDTSGDGQRINNGSDAVPPQIVGIIDNGISMDVASFAETATQVVTIGRPVGTSHRKLHAVLTPSGANESCDDVLSGSGTHGTIVASVIAAYPSQLGVFATRTKNGLGGAGVPRNANLDGVARGARIIMTDAGASGVCNINSLIERGGNVTPGLLSVRMNEFICPKTGGVVACAGITGGATEAHLAVTPFGLPDNFSTSQFLPSNGTYPESAVDLDTFLYNNRDFMIMSPVGNSGGVMGSNRVELAVDVVPDLFNGTDLDDCTPQPCLPSPPRPVQIAPPATAKNIVAVGTSRSDCVTFFGSLDCELRTVDFSSHGPATPQSLRTAPIITAPASDIIPTFETASIAVFRSRDNNQAAPIDNQIDEGNFGTSYSAANVTGAAAIMRDYFAQGFYPTGARTTANRVPNISGALVKALIITSAKFNTLISIQNHFEVAEQRLERSRGFDQGSPGGAFVGVIGNNMQGYGRVLLTGVLPIPNWSKQFSLNNGTNSEYPAQALLVYDDIATGEPLLGNDALAASCTPGATSCTHEFQVSGPETGAGAGGARAVFRAELRVGVAWPDVPSPAGSGGPLVNDLDLVVESPGPDNCLGAGYVKYDGTVCAAGTETDNRFYDGNNYVDTNSPTAGQWSRVRAAGQPEVHDFRNPQEAVHLNSDPSNNFTAADAARFSDSSLAVGTWRVTVKRGCGGSLPCVCAGEPATAGNRCYGNNATCDDPLTVDVGVCAPGTLSAVGGASEDLDGDRRLDAGEDVHDGAGGPANGRLDLGGQAYALAIAGPVFRLGPAPAAGPTAFPASRISLDRIRYGCSSELSAVLADSTGGSTALASSATTFTVQNAAGAVLDTETNVVFTAAASPGTFRSAPVPVRLAGATRTSFNGILEADTGNLVAATYAPAGQPAVMGSAQVKCSPDFIPGFFAFTDNISFGDQLSIGNGCDNDEYFDAGEILTYGVGVNNRSRTDDYTDVLATLTPSGPGAAAIRVLDSPMNVGRIPGNGFQGLFFHIFVDPAIANALPAGDRKVTMTLTLDSNAAGQEIGRQTYQFAHAINADKETFHYSTDFPAGGRQVRDLNRNLLIDTPDVLDPFLQIMMTDEDVTFSSMFVAGADNPNTAQIAAELVSNTLGEDLDADGLRDANEPDIIPNAALDIGILFAPAGPSPADKAPFNFENGSGGFVPVRHPASLTPGVSTPVWEYRTGGLCGFQTTLNAAIGLPDIFGIWHTGDGILATPGATATACDDHAVPSNPATENRTELYMDVLHSPIIAKVHQLPDALGFPFEVEFQRYAANFNMQVNDAYTGGGINIDNDADTDSENCLLCQQLDTYYTRRAGGWPYGMFRFSGQYFETGTGIDPGGLTGTSPKQRTFGPFDDPDGSMRVCTGGARPGEVCVSDADCLGTPPNIPDGTCEADDPGIPGNMDLTGDETGFTGFTENSNTDSKSPIPTAPPDFLAYPLPGAPTPGVCTGGTTPGGPCQQDGDCGQGGTCTLAANDIAGPARNFDTTLVNYEGQSSHEVLAGTSAPEEFFFFTPGPAGNRWLLGLGFFSIESTAGRSDYGFGVDDVVFEWDESHPGAESTAACNKFGGIGQPAGAQCATITVDRSQLYECEEALLITVVDPTAATPTIEVQIVTDSDSVLFATQRFAVFQPNQKAYTLSRVSTAPPTYQASITVSTSTNSDQTVNPGSNGNVFTNPGTDGSFIVYYRDPDCDADADGATAENLFTNYDGDGVADASDNCPFTYNPLQEDADADGLGDLCDNCPAIANADQTDKNADDVGDACENDDVDGDGLPEDQDNCPGLYQDTTRDTDLDGRGDACDGAICQNSPTTSCVSDAECPLRCSNSATRACVDPAVNCPKSCSGRPTSTCLTDADCVAPETCVTNETVCTIPGNCRGLITAAPDLDGDNVNDTVDNCLHVNNANQRNADNDGLGDLCDGDCTQLSVSFFCANERPQVACVDSNDCGFYCIENPDEPCNLLLFCEGGSSEGELCATDADCPDIAAGTCSALECAGGSTPGASCTVDGDCPDIAPGTCTPGVCAGGGNDGLACAVDGDCPDGVCSGRVCAGGATPGVSCTGDPDCPGSDATCSATVCAGGATPGEACTADVDCPASDGTCTGLDLNVNDCSNGGTCFFDSCQPIIVASPSGTCSLVDDDLDVDNVEDAVDNCATVVNTSIIPGTKRQADSDRDGLGDQCDPTGTFDDDFDGVPDDVLTFQGGIACRTLPLGSFAILSAEYRDTDGDHDIFPDTGENGIVVLTIQNNTRDAASNPMSLTGASFTITSSDSDVDCITTPTIVAGAVAAGQTLTLGVLPDANGQGGSGFTFRASDSLQTVSPASPAKTEFCLTASANETLGTTAPVCFTLLADLELPVGVVQEFTLGPDGIAGTGDDGRTEENFDVDRDGDGDIDVNDMFLQPDGSHAFYIYGSATGVGANLVAGIPCGGFAEPAAGNAACALDPDYPMDWHVHCAPGASNCPNNESGSGNSIGTGACVGGCSYATPANGQRALSVPNSMHMGAHFDLGDETRGDTTHFRMVAAFVTAPINLALFPRPGDLQLSMFHIADIMDNNGVGGGNNEGQCSDCGDVQIRVDLDVSPAVDTWGTWDKLVPFQNVYDHKGMAWSAFANYYCLFTPGDTGTAPPAPRGVHETMCFPIGLWSHCGSVRGLTPTTTFDCLGATGVMDPQGRGVWVETRFNLAGYLGQRIQVRWIGESWVFDFASSSYYETGAGWDNNAQDDGWWLDNIRFTGTITTQLTPPPDFDAGVVADCPAGCNPAVGDNGTAAALRFTDLADHDLTVASVGQGIRVHANQSTIPGGCVDGVAQFQFKKNGLVVQDWSGKSFYQDGPEADATYQVLVRCSTSFACTSATGASATLGVYKGQGDQNDLPLTVTHDRVTGTTTLNWPSRAQLAPMAGFNVYRGSRTDDGLSSTASTPDASLTTLVQHACNVPAGALNATLNSIDAAAPALHSMTYYLVGHRNGTGAQTGLGRRSDGSVRYSPVAVTCP